MYKEKDSLRLILSILAFFFSTFGLLAQDVIKKKNGETMKVFIIKQDQQYIYYSNKKDRENTSGVIKKSLVSSIEFETKRTGLSHEDSTQNIQNKKIVASPISNFSATGGFLQGGGALIGVDMEALISKRVGVQAGLGITAFGLAMNYHLKGDIESSFVTIMYWYQGFGDLHTQSALGPAFVYRAPKGFTFQLGLAKTLDKGPGWDQINFEQPPVMLTYAVGYYKTF